MLDGQHETAGIDVALKALPPEVARSSGEMEEVRAPTLDEVTILACRIGSATLTKGVRKAFADNWTISYRQLNDH